MSFAPPANPPPNPIRGAFWWDGSTLWLFDGAVWVDTTTGAITPPGGGGGGGGGGSVSPVGTTTQVFAIASPNQITIPANAWTVLAMTTTPLVDTQGGFDLQTKKYTPKIAGVYQFFSIVALTAATGVIGVAFLKNDSGTFAVATDPCVGLNVATPGSSGYGWLSTNTMVHMNGTTDFVRLFVYDQTGGPCNGFGQVPVMAGWLMP